MNCNKITFASFMLACTLCMAADKAPFGSIVFKGGRLEPIDLTLVESSNEHINFCFAHRFSDGSIYLNHSKGIHTVTEYSHSDYSLDNGKTWQESKVAFGFNAYEMLDGTRCAISCWDAAQTTTHAMTRSILGADNQSATAEACTIELPEPSSFRLHRDVTRCKSGRLLLTGYGLTKGEGKLHSFVICSDDDGLTWRYLSTIMSDPEKQYGEGPNECAVMELDNGELLAEVRVAGIHGLIQLRSTDGGITWQEEGEIAGFCVAPSMQKMQDGTLLIITGRPGLYLLVDFSGTGREWQQIAIYNGSGSSYASVIESAPGVLTIIHDESDFGGWQNTSNFSRLVAERYRLVKTAQDEVTEGGDPRVAGWDTYYSPAEGKTLNELNIANGTYSKPDDDPKEAYYEFFETEMRPHKLLRLHNTGKGEVIGHSQFANYSTVMPRGSNEFSMRCECRIVDGDQYGPQVGFSAGFAVQVPKSTTRFVWIGLQQDGVLYHLQDGKYKLAPYPIGLDFHEIRMTGSLAENEIKVYVDDISKPLFTMPFSENPQSAPRIAFGDGATNVFGTCDIVDIAWASRKKDFSKEIEQK